MRKALVAAVVAVLGVLALAGPAAADELTIRKVDTTDYPTVRLSVLVTGQTPDIRGFAMRENEQIVKEFDVVPLGETNVPVGIVLVIDISGSMRTNNKMDQAKAAAKQFIAALQPNEQVAVVAFNDAPRVAANFTNDKGLLSGVIDGLVATGETALFDAIRLGAGLFTERPDLQPNMVILSDGKDTVSSATNDQARASVVSAGSTAFAIGLRGGDFDAGSLQSIAGATGGQYVETSDPTTLASLYSKVQTSIQNQYEVTYTSSPNAGATGALDIVLTNGQLQASTTTPVGGIVRGTATERKVIKPSTLPGPLTSTGGRWIAAALVLLAVGLLAYGLILVFVRERSALETAVSTYESPLDRTGEGIDDDGDDVSLADTAIVRRAIDTTARIAEERGLLVKVERKLDQADLPLRPAEVIFFNLAVAIIAVAAALLLAGPLAGLVALIVFGLGPMAVLNLMGSRRQKRFTSQLPDMLQLLAGSLRAGYSLLQGIDAVAQQVEEPMGKELRRALGEARLGRPMEEALADVATRMGSPDFEWAVMAIRIQREVGGNLAELLMTVSDTMIARERLRRDVSALTAEGRISAIVLGILPIGLAGLLYVLNPEYMGQLTESNTGQFLIGFSIVLALIGFYWMKKTIEIEI